MKAYKHEVEMMKDDTRLALLEQSTGHINESLLRIEKRFDKLENKIDGQYRWIIGGILTLLGTIITALLKGHLT